MKFKTNGSKKICIIYAIFAALLVLAGCGIETYQPVVNLSSPLGLIAYETNSNAIVLQFWGENDETWFSGYDIYVAETQADLQANNGMRLLNTDGKTDKPTIYNVPPMTSARQFTYTVSYYTNFTPLQTGTTYFFFVKAYSQQYNIFSDPSNITNVTF